MMSKKNSKIKNKIDNDLLSIYTEGPCSLVEAYQYVFYWKG